MTVTRADVEASLAIHDAEGLQMILAAAGVSARGAETPRDLAARIADALWWTWCTPIGYVADRTSLEHIVVGVARKLRSDSDLDPEADAWTQLRTLTASLLGDVQAAGVTLEDLDPATRARVWPDWLATMGLAAGSSTSLGAAWAGKGVLAFLNSPIGRLLPLIPPLTPWLPPIRAGAGAAAMVGGPLGIALGALTLNQALGANYHKLVPLLLGVGALGPSAVAEADEVKAEVA